MENEEHIRRWRLLLGSASKSELDIKLSTIDKRIDDTLGAVYDADEKRRGGLGNSAPKVSRWLGELRDLFPQSVVQVVQQDAIERLDLKMLLTEPEVLAGIEPDVHLVATLLSLSHLIPDKNKDMARTVVRKLVDELIAKLQNPMEAAVTGALNRSVRRRRPRHNEIDWATTIKKNLRHYQADYKTVIPETLYGFGRKQRSLKDIVLCLDQSGSMGTSVVYTGIFASVMASIPALSTRLVVFDTSVVDLTEEVQDPVDLLFGVQLGGGTDIAQALTYCQSVITRPEDTTLILITDLYEGGDERKMKRLMASLVDSGVQMICLPALNDDGASYYDKDNASYLASLGVPTFACTPDKFPDLMAAALSKQDLSLWASTNIEVAKP